MRRVTLASLVMIGASFGVAWAQEVDPATLSMDDSVAIYTEVVEVTLRELGPNSAGQDLRIWIPGALHTGPAGALSAPAIPEPMRSVLSSAFPGLRFVEDHRNIFSIVFVCPEGVELRMPGSGCPVEDGGVVIRLGPLAPGESGDVWTHSSLAQSAVSGGPDETISWMQGFRLRLSRSAQGDWEVVEIGAVSIT